MSPKYTAKFQALHPASFSKQLGLAAVGIVGIVPLLCYVNNAQID